MKSTNSCVFIFIVLFISCNQQHGSTHLFEVVAADESGIHFQNTIIENDSINVIDFQYCYNGGGVGIGDFNNDGRYDVFFGGNQTSSKLYLNLGNLEFSDITEKANLSTHQWVTGISIVDINADGFDDIYLNVGGANCQGNCQNLLYINQGVTTPTEVPTFKEMAAEYGLDEAEYAQQTVFFDYDLDGDLDAFIARNGNVRFDKNAPIPKNYYPEHLTDILLENTQQNGLSHPYFVDVSKQLGIMDKGFALGLGVTDFNGDLLPDIYVGNDFISNDLMYINKKQDSVHRFAEESKTYLKHQTYNAMGVDLADVNNDGLQDVLVLDMLPYSNERRKMMMGITNYDKYRLALKNQYTPQTVKNTLQINLGILNNKPVGFQDVAFSAGIAATDWSWAPLFVDFDGDGDKDLMVTNGYGKDVTDLDFINYSSQNNVFGTPEARDERIKTLLKDRPRVLMPNFFFENQNGLQFKDLSHQWWSGSPSISNGAAYADFDNDGDLDIMVNNIDQKAFVLKNNSDTNPNFKYLKVNLVGNTSNKKGLGSTINVWNNGKIQSHYVSVIRGYLSSVTPTAFFGLQESVIDSIQVLWPDGRKHLLSNVSANQTLTISQNTAKKESQKPEKKKLFLFEESSTSPIVHQENISNDYTFQHLLPSQHSKQGPCVASSDKEQLVFIGGSHGTEGQLFIILSDGSFQLKKKLDAIYEDSFAVFFDVDNDGDQDLYVGSGGSEYSKNDQVYTDRLYKNEGDNFLLTEGLLPDFRFSTSGVLPLDYDNDGDEDIFISSRLIPKEYPSSPTHILLNNNGGQFSIAQKFSEIGMISAAIPSDIDNDGWPDILIATDWGPIQTLKNTNGTLQASIPKIQNDKNEAIDTSGWWKSIAAGDFDNDGDVDFLVGNQGTNNFINPTQQYPIYIYNGDFDNNGSIDPLIGAFQNTEKGVQLMPYHSRDDATKQLMSLKGPYPSYESFSKVDFESLLNISDLEKATLSVKMSESVILLNNGNFEFSIQPLPLACQFGPITAILVEDFDNDGNLDAVVAGNDFQAEPRYGRYDAHKGIYLKGNGQGNFSSFLPSKSGFHVPGQASQITTIQPHENKNLILVGQNNDSLKIFSVNSRL